jgi:hypothetical protein
MALKRLRTSCPRALMLELSLVVDEVSAVDEVELVVLGMA